MSLMRGARDQRVGTTGDRQVKDGQVMCIAAGRHVRWWFRHGHHLSPRQVVSE